MPPPIDTSRDLLFGILALQNGLIDQGDCSRRSPRGVVTSPNP